MSATSVTGTLRGSQPALSSCSAAAASAARHGSLPARRPLGAAPAGRRCTPHLQGGGDLLHAAPLPQREVRGELGDAPGGVAAEVAAVGERGLQARLQLQQLWRLGVAPQRAAAPVVKEVQLGQLQLRTQRAPAGCVSGAGEGWPSATAVCW
jgi:hypothetical protein